MLQLEEYLTYRGEKSGSEIECNLSDLPPEPFDNIPLIEEEMKAEVLFYICNLFSTSPIEDTFVWFGAQRIAKAVLYDMVLVNRLSEVFFLRDILSHLDRRTLPTLCAFLNSLLIYLLTRNTKLQRADAAYLSDYVLLSWWNQCFPSPEAYCLLSATLDSNFVASLKHFTPSLMSQLAQFPEHSNLVTVNLMRIYSCCGQQMVDQEETVSKCTKQPEDSASRMVGIHANVALHRLAEIYSKCVKQSHQEAFELSIPRETLNSVQNTVTYLLQQVVSCGLVNSLRQRPDLPLCPNSVKQLLIDRFNTVRDFHVTRACRYLAASLTNPTSAAFPSKLNGIVHAAAPKHLFSTLLSSVPSCPGQISPSGDNAPASFDPHRILICWCLQHGIGVKDYASWFVSNSDIKDVHLAQCVLSDLCAHAALLASDSSFCLALIQRMERVRKATLPEQDYLKLLRLVLKHLSNQSKSSLLQELHSPSNPSGATPLPKSGSHWEAQTRKLFNRLVVLDTTGPGKTVSAETSIAVNYEPYSQAVNSEFVLDCELLLLTRPVCFLTELILLPISRRCPASQPAVHQLLGHLSYCLPVPIATVSVPTGPESDESISKSESSLMEAVLLKGLASRHSPRDTSLLIHLQAEPSDEDAMHFDPIFTTTETEPSASVTSIPPGEHKEAAAIFVSGPKHPLVETLGLLMNLAPQILPNLLAHLTVQLQSVLQKAVQPVEGIERFLEVLLSAILLVIEGIPASCSPQLVLHLLSLFEVLFLSDCTTFGQTTLNELDLLLVGVISAMLRKTPGGVLLETEKEQFFRLRETLRSHEFDPRIFRLWILWFPVFTTVLGSSESGYFEIPAYICNLLPANGVVLQLDTLAAEFGLQFSTITPPSGKRRCSSHLSPGALGFLFLLASMSPQAARAITNSLIVANESSNDDIWGPDGSSSNVLLLALLLFLRTASEDRQPNRWGRVFYVIDHLVRVGVLILPYRPRQFEPGKSTTPTNSLPLMDWSDLRGKLDLFAVYAELLYLWLTQLPQSMGPDVAGPSWELRLLCTTISILVQRLGPCLTFSTDVHSSRFSRIVRTHTFALLEGFRQRLEQPLLNSLKLFTLATRDVEQLITSIQMITQQSSSRGD